MTFLHVANGTSTTMTIEAAGLPGERSIWADPLYEGPVPGGLSDDELCDVRARYLGGDEAPDPVNDLRRWRDVIDREAYDELVLWYEHDLFCQLNLIQILSRIGSRLPRATPVSLICIGSFPGRPDFHGLGELSPPELASLFGTRRPVSDAEYALAERAWRAFREPTPEAVDALRRQDTSALPFLGRALHRFLEEYPWTKDGLSRSERRLLRLVEGGPIRAHAVFPRMHEDEDAYYISDLSLVGTIESLSCTSPPLVTLSDIGNPDRLEVTVSLTEAGRDVLAGALDRVACGMDRWLGGVHLQNGTSIWRWDDGAQCVRQDARR